MICWKFCTQEISAYESFRENNFFREKCFHSDLRLDRRKLTFTDASDTEKQNKNDCKRLNKRGNCLRL